MAVEARWVPAPFGSAPVGSYLWGPAPRALVSAPLEGVPHRFMWRGAPECKGVTISGEPTSGKIGGWEGGPWDFHRLEGMKRGPSSSVDKCIHFLRILGLAPQHWFRRALG